tara:strand:+ start:120 stop:371 length:252 start_codon:yes stop_codon:yes gene_type:complete
VSNIYKTVYIKVIFQAIRDLVGARAQEKDDAIKYLQSPAFLAHCDVAGFPCGLQDALDEMLLLSKTEQKVVAKMVMEELAANA